MSESGCGSKTSPKAMPSYSFRVTLSIALYLLLGSGHCHQNETTVAFYQDEASASASANRARLMRPSLFRPSIFHVVKFPNDECFDASNQSGTCYTPLECKAFGGTGTSSCAKGYGTCCIISRSCHNRTSQKVVYFKNPSYPQPDSQQNYCDLTVEIKDPDICQIRLDLLDFQLDQPTNGECLGDKLTISASGLSTRSMPKLCGTNRNQHLYISLPQDMADRSASLLFVTNTFGPYRWHVRVTQIDCVQNPPDKVLRQRRALLSPFTPQAGLKVSVAAPPGCLQYFTSSAGVVESFNFGEYLNNLDYAICIQRLPSTCRVKFSASDYEWNIDKPTQPKLSAGVGDDDCTTDYLLIPGASSTGDDPTRDRYCGGRLSYQRGATLESAVISKANGPIVLRFHSDPTHDATVKDGFRLRFEQSSTNCEPSFQPTVQPLSPYLPTPVAAALIEYNRGQQLVPSRNNAKRLTL